MLRAHEAAGVGGPPQKLEGQRPRCPHATRAQGRRGRRPSTKNGGATAAMPSCYARTRPPGPAALHKNGRGNGRDALMLRAHKAAEAGGPPQKMEGQRPRCPHATRAQGRRGRRPSTKTGGATALLPFSPRARGRRGRRPSLTAGPGTDPAAPLNPTTSGSMPPLRQYAIILACEMN